MGGVARPGGRKVPRGGKQHPAGRRDGVAYRERWHRLPDEGRGVDGQAATPGQEGNPDGRPRRFILLQPRCRRNVWDKFQVANRSVTLTQRRHFLV